MRERSQTRSVEGEGDREARCASLCRAPSTEERRPSTRPPTGREWRQKVDFSRCCGPHPRVHRLTGQQRGRLSRALPFTPSQRSSRRAYCTQSGPTGAAYVKAPECPPNPGRVTPRICLGNNALAPDAMASKTVVSSRGENSAIQGTAGRVATILAQRSMPYLRSSQGSMTAPSKLARGMRSNASSGVAAPPTRVSRSSDYQMPRSRERR